MRVYYKNIGKIVSGPACNVIPSFPANGESFILEADFSSGAPKGYRLNSENLFMLVKGYIRDSAQSSYTSLYHRFKLITLDLLLRT